MQPFCQHDLTPRIYVLHKITIALKFMSYINQVAAKLSNRVKFVLHKLKISGRSARGRAEQLAPWQLVVISDRGIAKCISIFFIY